MYLFHNLADSVMNSLVSGPCLHAIYIESVVINSSKITFYIQT